MFFHSLVRITFCSTLLAIVAACGSSNEPVAQASALAAAPAAASAAAPLAPSPEAAKAEASQIFATRCTPCHGPSGHGDGPASAGLTPKPRNFGDAAWQQAVSDDHLQKIIQYGGAAVGRSPAMPANPDLTSKPDVVAALAAHVRSLGAKP